MKMKRITGMPGGVLTAALLLSTWGEEAYAATATSLVEARVMLTISISNLTGLSFGTISAGPTPGTVTVQSDGKVIGSGGLSLGDTASASAATFQLNGQPDMTFTIQLPTTVLLNNPQGDTLAVGDFQSQPGVTGKLDATGALVLRVGGTLEVGAAQPPGNYTGLMSVSVNYN